MDSSLLQLFTAQELLQRLSEKSSTGALHAFTPKESANIFFKEGKIIGAAKGLVEGEEVVKQIMEWKEARFVWQQDCPLVSLTKPIEIEFEDFLIKVKAAPKLEIGGKLVGSETSSIPPKPVLDESPAELRSTGKVFAKGAPLPPKSAGVEPAPIFITIPSKAATTGRIEPKTSSGPTAATEVPALTATKNINSTTPEGRVSREEALLRKFPLSLASAGDGPQKRLKITRLSSLIGRNPACDFTIENGSISRQHCLLQITDRGLHVKDLGTTNGTKVNGIPLTEGYVNVGDKLMVGNLAFLVEKDEIDVEA